MKNTRKSVASEAASARDQSALTSIAATTARTITVMRVPRIVRHGPPIAARGPAWCAACGNPVDDSCKSCGEPDMENYVCADRAQTSALAPVDAAFALTFA